MPTYFGQQTTTYGTENPGAAWDRNYNTVFTCPGSGKQQVKEIAMYTRQTSGACNIRLAIYTHSGILIAEGSAEVAVSGTAGWQGHMTPSVIKPLGGSAGDPVLLDGGTNYRIAITCDGKIWFYSDVTLGFSDDWRQVSGTEYTSGWPSFRPDPTNQDYGNWAVRVGVDPWLLEEANETEQISEGVVRRMSMNRPLGETEQLAESVSRRSFLNRVLNETVNIVEGVVKTLTPIGTALKEVVDETVQISEGVIKTLLSAITKVLDETINLSGSVLRNLVFNRIINETLQTIESILRPRTMVRILAESINIVEAVVKSISTSITRIINESINITESIAGIGGLIKILNESISIVESLLSKVALSAAKVIKALRRIFIMDTEIRVFILDNSRRVFTLDTERRVFYVR